MNILIINHYAGALCYGMEFRAYYLASEWIKSGHNVRILTADFSHLRSLNPGEKKDFEITEIDGIEYQWIHTSKYETNGVKRAITMLQFCGKLFKNAKKIAVDYKPDVIITSSTYPLDTYPGQKIAKFSGAKYIHEGHDLWPLTLTELMGMSKFNPLVVMLGIAEKSAYKKSDHVVSVLAYSWKYMLKHGMQSKEKFTCIPNGIVVEDWDNPTQIPEEHSKILSELKKQGKYIVCYLGGHAPSNALDTLIEAGLKTENKNISYVLVGKGNQKELLINKAGNADNIYFLPPVDKKAVPTLLAMADFLYIGAARCSLYKYGVSMNKVYDYMMAGKPIIYCVEAANNDVEDAECGKTVECENPDMIIKTIEEFIAMNDEEISLMGSNGKKAVMEKYNYKVLADTFLRIMSDN